MNPKLTPIMSLVVKAGDTPEIIDQAIALAEEHKWIERISKADPFKFPSFFTDTDVMNLADSKYKPFPERSIYGLIRFQHALIQTRHKHKQK